jgi:putative ABC transport system substrate-binding protein
VRRRDFVKGIVGLAAALPAVVRAQQANMPLIGFLNGQSPQSFKHLVAGFLQGLREAGYVEGQNVQIEFRWANGDFKQLPRLADELAHQPIAVLVATGGADSIVKTLPSKIPIIFTTAGEPVRDGLVSSFNKPGGNATGVSVLSTATDAKRIELLHELVPKISTIGVMLDPRFSFADLQLDAVHAAERAIGVQTHILKVSTEQQIDEAFASLAENRIGALGVLSNPYLNSRRSQLVALAERYALPSIYEARDFPVSGGLISYGANIADVYRQVGVYTGRVIKGEKPADLPVLQPTKFELVINLKTAKVLGLDVPPTLLALADEVIE